MKSIAENINESNSFSKISEKKSLKKNSSLPSLNKLSLGNKNNNISAKKIKINKKHSKSDLSDSDYLHNIHHQNEKKSVNNFAYKIISKDKFSKISLSERILLDFFINISEFNEKNFDFFVNYSELCKALINVGLIDKKLFKNNIIVTKNELDIILKETQSNNNSSKKLNYKEFIKFFAHLTYKLDPLHFIDKPKNTLNFFINKYIFNYNNSNNNLISNIYAYVLTIQKEKNINEILKEILPFLNSLYTFYFINYNSNEESKDDINNNDKNNFELIIHVMKYLDIYPILINIKKLVIMFYIILDDSNDNNYLDVDIITNEYNIFSFKKFCQFFLTLCLYIKENNLIALKQYSYLLCEDKNNSDHNQKERIIKYILNLKIRNKKSKINDKNEKEENFNFEELTLNNKEINLLKDFFESYSSFFDKYLNYQISFTDILSFLNDFHLIKNKKYKNNEIKDIFQEKILKAQKKTRNKIIKVKESLHSQDYLFRPEKNIKSKIVNDNPSNNSISLVDIEILFSKVQQKEKISFSQSMDKAISTNNNNKKDYNLKIRLNFKSFIHFLFLLSNKLRFDSFSLFIDYLSFGHNNKKLKNRRITLKYLYDKYQEFISNELSDIIKEFSPIIHLYYVAYVRSINKNKIDYNIYSKIISDFEIFPYIVNNNILKNIFDLLYRIGHNTLIYNEENKEVYLVEKNKEIEFKEFMYSFGIIAFYLNEISELDEIQSFLALFYLIIKSDKIKLVLKDIHHSFVEILRNKITEISKKYNIIDEEPEYIKYLKEPYL